MPVEETEGASFWALRRGDMTGRWVVEGIHGPEGLTVGCGSAGKPRNEI